MVKGKWKTEAESNLDALLPQLIYLKQENRNNRVEIAKLKAQNQRLQYEKMALETKLNNKEVSGAKLYDSYADLFGNLVPLLKANVESVEDCEILTEDEFKEWLKANPDVKISHAIHFE